MGTPSERQDKIYYFKTQVCKSKCFLPKDVKSKGVERVILDPNQWDVKGTTH